MKTLFLDTAGNPNFIAICSEDGVLASGKLKKHDDGALIPEIERLLMDAGIKYSDLTNLACASGPGGFTSLRIGLTAINTLSDTLNIPSASIHLSELWHARVKNDQAHLWLHSTRKDALFVKGFGTNGKSTPVALMNMNEALALRGSYIGELIEEHKKALPNCRPMPDGELLKPMEALPTVLSTLQYKHKILIPWYGRPA